MLLAGKTFLGTAFARVATPGEPPTEPTEGEWAFIRPHPARTHPLGRITWSTALRAGPTTQSELLGWVETGDIVPLFEAVDGPGPNPNNRTWWRIDGGYIYSAFVQPIAPYRTPTILTEMPDAFGFWVEVIAPYTIARLAPGGDPVSTRREPFYSYSSVYHVASIEERRGEIWYEVVDDMRPTTTCWVLARHLRPIPEEEFAPINPDEVNKQIIIVLGEQRVYALEGDEIVLSTLCASGFGENETPQGWTRVQWKKPSRHMVGSDFNLPGVPWNTYFNATEGFAIHGTYWHSDYGQPRSHGCVNVTPEAANWIYRWTTPYPPYRNDFVLTQDLTTATPIVILDYYDVEAEGAWGDYNW